MKSSNLVLGVGNPGRKDDGLGYEFVRSLQFSPNYETRHAYQLNIEDSEDFCRYQKVLVVDATRNTSSFFKVYELEPKVETPFSTHGLTLAGVMALARELYGTLPEIRLLAISGYEFQIGLGLSIRGMSALAMAIKWFQANLLANNDEIF